MLNELSIQVRYFCILLAVYMLVITSFAVHFDWSANIGYWQKMAFMNRFFTDFLQFTALLLLLNAGNKLYRYLANLFILIFAFGYFTQSQSFGTVGQFLPAVALENVDHIDFLDVNKIVTAAFIWGVCYLALCFAIARFVPRTRLLPSILAALIVLLVSVAVKNDDKWLSQETLQTRFDFYNSGRAGIQQKSPLGELAESYSEYFAYLRKQNFVADQAEAMSEPAALFAYQNFESFGEVDADYPLMRDFDFSKSLPFLIPNKKAKPNVIIFFAEGLSSRLVQPYSQLFDGLTPNIQQFAESALRVNDYRNHTFATYRGLAGQLCSLYPVGRLYAEVNYYCVGHALQTRGYSTHFMVSQRLDRTDLDHVLQQAGFDKVDGSRDIARMLTLPNADQASIIPDRQLIQGLITKLRRLEQRDPSQPFALGLYNFETHTGARLIESSARYTGTSNNPREPNYVLDKFYNFDQVFGEFWQYFKQSPLYKNTVVVLTSDHATSPDKEYVDLLNDAEDYTRIFIDEIPLLIYHPDLLQATQISAGFASSLDFAPSLLHLLGVSQLQAAFLGNSLFTPTTNDNPFANLGGGIHKFWFKNDQGFWKMIDQDKRSDVPDEQIGRFDFLRYAQSLERANKLWKPDSDNNSVGIRYW